MTDPVIAANGHTYDRCAREEWISHCNRSPITQEKLDHTILTPNRVLRAKIYEEENVGK